MCTTYMCTTIVICINVYQITEQEFKMYLFTNKFQNINYTVLFVANFKDALLVEHKADRVWNPSVMDYTSEEEGNCYDLFI